MPFNLDMTKDPLYRDGAQQKSEAVIVSMLSGGKLSVAEIAGYVGVSADFVLQVKTNRGL